MKTEMMAAVLYGKENLQVEPVAVPKIEKGDLLVRVKVALTCGTDVKVFRRGYHARMIVPPAEFGHELAGDIVACGEGVAKFSIGQRVVAANSAPCDRCYFCSRGLENLCEDLLFNNGAYAEYIRIPARIVERNTYEIPADVSYQDAALVEPLACVLRGLEETGIRVGKVRYHSSQPWPFPASLMVGFHAQALSHDITIDREELEDARWFSRAEIQRFPQDGLSLPRPDAIARRLIEAWLAGNAGNW